MRKSHQLIFAIAYSLPPKLVEVSLKSDSALGQAAHVAARKVEIVSSEPVLHGGMSLSKDKRSLLILNADATAVTELALDQADAKPRSRSIDTATKNALLASQTQTGAFAVESDKVAFRPDRSLPGALWEVPLGFEPLGLAMNGDGGALWGWGAYPAHLLTFPADRRNFYKIDWQEDSEPVAVVPCDGARAVLVENLRSGSNRFVFFTATLPKKYALIDFTGDKRSSDISGVAARSCEDIFVAGTFGVARVRFDVKSE
ncbi:MAG: hypothetical protein JST16_00830 [Bdellovibrionales bacterium]|nr:hypothetical protein [Bdellovibrionales bacterium]